MKKTLFTAGLLIALAPAAFSQLVLHTGDTWTYNFNNLPRTGSVPVFTSTPGGTFQFTINGSSFQSGDQLRYEMFETSTSDPAICSALFSSEPPNDATCTTDLAWQDQQGAVRLSMLSGSLIIDSVTIKAIVSGPSLSSYDVYSTTFTPVPEPTTIAFLALVTGLVILHRKRLKCKLG